MNERAGAAVANVTLGEKSALTRAATGKCEINLGEENSKDVALWSA